VVTDELERAIAVSRAGGDALRRRLSGSSADVDQAERAENQMDDDLEERLRIQWWRFASREPEMKEALHVTTRFRRKDFGHMDIGITMDDPKPIPGPGATRLK